MSQLLTTAAVEPARQLAYWTEMVCDTYVQLDCDAAADARDAASAPDAGTTGCAGPARAWAASFF